jgi:hypothetical protein
LGVKPIQKGSRLLGDGSHVAGLVGLFIAGTPIAI